MIISFGQAPLHIRQWLMPCLHLSVYQAKLLLTDAVFPLELFTALSEFINLGKILVSVLKRLLTLW